MAKLLDKQRYKCALGAMQTVQAIERAIPILHSGPGCAQKLSDGNGVDARQYEADELALFCLQTLGKEI